MGQCRIRTRGNADDGHHPNHPKPPMARPVRNAFGVIDVAPLLLIDVATDQSITGRSYLFAYSKITLKAFVHLVEEIGRDLIGKPVVPYDLMAAMDAKFRLLGWQGL